MDIKEELVSGDEKDWGILDNIRNFSDGTTKTYKSIHRSSDALVGSELETINRKIPSEIKYAIDQETEVAKPEIITIVYENEEGELNELEYKIVVDAADSKIECFSHEKVNEEVQNKSNPLAMNVCVRCSRSFETLKELGIHYRSLHYKKRKTVWPQKPTFVKKKLSNIKYVTASQYKIKNAKYQCNQCKVCFDTYKKLYHHRRTHTHPKSDVQNENNPLGTNVCPRCSRTFETSKELKIHQKKHRRKQDTVQSQKIIILRKKKSSLDDGKHKTELTLEKKIVDSKKGVELWCKKCNESFDTYKELHRHLATDKHARSDVCDICNKKFKYRYLMRLHRKSHMGDNRKLLVDYHCIVCDIDVNTFPEVIVHYEENHAGKRECILCGTLVPQGYKKHLQSHRIRVYKCEPCNMFFNSNQELIKHYHSDEHNEVKKCKICNVIFPSAARVRVHMKSAHQPELCEFCGLICKALADHKRYKHATTKTLICEFCGKSYPTKTYMERHISQAHCKRLVCYICMKTFANSVRLKDHYQVHSEHESLNKTRSTCECGMELKSFCEAFYHALNVHNTYSCHKCEATFTEKSKMIYHIENHDLSFPVKCTKEGTMCLVCKKIFKYKSSLRYHMFLHIGQKVHECSFCTKKFMKPYHLKQHMRVHTKEKPYSCDKCGKRYASKSAMKYHLAQGHKTGLEMFKCNICSREFKSEFLCRSHQQRMHSEKPYSCNKCNKTFGSKPAIKYHLTQVHRTSSEMYQCNICLREFKSEFLCRGHQQRMHSENPYSCDICHKKLGSKLAMKYHMSKVHKASSEMFQCNICFYEFKSEVLCRSHQQRVHSDQIREEPTFTVQDKLFDVVLPYKNPKTEANNQDYKCEFCVRVFKSENACRNHTINYHSHQYAGLEGIGMFEKFSSGLLRAGRTADDIIEPSAEVIIEEYVSESEV